MKQEKISRANKHTLNSGQKTPLGTKPNDECYTGMQDILNELSQWAALNKFKGKNIICPCDWDIVNGENIYSITIIYKEPNVEVERNSVFKAVKSIHVDLWSDDGDATIDHITLKEDEIEDFLRDKLTCNFVRTLTQNARAWGIKSITASGYNPANGKGVKFQDVDYSKYDICITNPPFSLYAEFMECVVDKIDFIVLAPFLNRVTPNVGLYLMLKKAYLGFGRSLGKMQFYNPTSANNFKTKVINCDWITSFSDAQDILEEKPLHLLDIHYEDYKDEYIIMENMTMKDGTHPIRVPETKFPCDYDGWMFTSIGVLNTLNRKYYDWYGTSFKKYYNTTNPESNPFNHKACDSAVNVGDKRMFHGIVFKRKF